jgi:hypothetical protein
MAITGQVPLAELDGYQSRLKSLTAGAGLLQHRASRITRRCRRRRNSNSLRRHIRWSTRSSERAVNRRRGAVTVVDCQARRLVSSAGPSVAVFLGAQLGLPRKGFQELRLDPAQAGLLRAAGPPSCRTSWCSSRNRGGPACRAPRRRIDIAAGSVQARSFFFVNRDRSPAGRARDEQCDHSPLLADLIRADHRRSADRCAVAAGGHPLGAQSPGKQDSILKALFSETWRPSGAWRQLLAIVLHGRQRTGAL